MTPFAAIIAFVLGILLITIWSAIHIVLTIFGWILVIGAGVWLLVYLFGSRNRSVP
jgi:hypothetical protein